METVVEPLEDREFNDPRWNLLQRKAQEMNVARAFSLFRSEGIEPIVIKGFAAQRNYPLSHLRMSTDIDLAVASSDFERSVEISRSPSAEGLAIDLHRGLRHLDTVDWNDLFDNSVTVESGDVSIRILRPEDHLRVLCVHWLTDGGAFKERLWDIYYALEKSPAGFNWHRCLDIVSPNRRRWIACVIGITSKYLGLNVDHFPFANEMMNLPRWLEKALEREWASEIRLTSIDIYLGDPVNLVKQIKKRIPPSPIQSTIEMEGSFDAKTRVHYQAASMIRRFIPSVRRVYSTIARRHK